MIETTPTGTAVVENVQAAGEWAEIFRVETVSAVLPRVPLRRRHWLQSEDQALQRALGRIDFLPTASFTSST